MKLYCVQEWNINRLSYEYDSEPFGKERDAAIKKLANEAGVEVIVRISHTLYDLDKYVLLNSFNCVGTFAPGITFVISDTLISPVLIVCYYLLTYCKCFSSFLNQYK